MFTLLEEIKGQTTQNTKLINVLTNKIESIQEKPDSTNLPFETMEIFEEVEGKLEDQSFHKCMVKKINNRTYKFKII